MKTCIAPYCNSTSYRSDNLCDTHHYRQKRHNSLDKPSRKNQNSRKWSDEEQKDICKCYLSNIEIREITTKYKTGTSQIYKVLRLNNIAPYKGNQNRNKDGTITPEGYKKITRNGKYILEHRYVMEQHLGRQLLKTENVHHINGVRDDNRIENLELWSTSQPCGQRVIDKLEWAKQMISLYGNLK